MHGDGRAVCPCATPGQLRLQELQAFAADSMYIPCRCVFLSCPSEFTYEAPVPPLQGGTFGGVRSRGPASPLVGRLAIAPSGRPLKATGAIAAIQLLGELGELCGGANFGRPVPRPQHRYRRALSRLVLAERAPKVEARPQVIVISCWQFAFSARRAEFTPCSIRPRVAFAQRRKPATRTTLLNPKRTTSCQVHTYIHTAGVGFDVANQDPQLLCRALHHCPLAGQGPAKILSGFAASHRRLRLCGCAGANRERVLAQPAKTSEFTQTLTISTRRGAELVDLRSPAIHLHRGQKR